MQYLDKIHGPSDLKKIPLESLPVLAKEMRQALLKKLSEHGGHIGPNLGFVEGSIALHYVFESPVDAMVFDVSHQIYCHKMLTGRVEAFLDPKHYDDVSGFSNPDESPHDYFHVGHTSTSLSLALGLAKARDLRKEKHNVIAVIGDGSLSGGEALEGLDSIGEYTGNIIVILNDNEMSIAEDHGGLYKNLALLRQTEGKAENNMFRAWGIDYRYVGEGNDAETIIKALREVKDIDHPVLVHLHTKKGKGYSFAEENPEKYHAGGPFDLETGAFLAKPKETYPSLFAPKLVERCLKDPSFFVINAATPSAFALRKELRLEMGDQFLDVGIAEENAAGIASGVARGGATPVWVVASTFMQRTYDQIAQDISLNKSPVTILEYGSSASGFKDCTHLGFFDIPLLSGIPNLRCLAPTSVEEAFSMFEEATHQRKGPTLIRLPQEPIRRSHRDYDFSHYEWREEGEGIAILALGSFLPLGERLAEAVYEKTGRKATLINPRFFSSLDEESLEKIAEKHSKVVTLEDGVLDGGFGERIARYFGPSEVKVYCFGYKKEFVDRYNYEGFLEKNGLTVEQILAKIL